MNSHDEIERLRAERRHIVAEGGDVTDIDQRIAAAVQPCGHPRADWAAEQIRERQADCEDSWHSAPGETPPPDPCPACDAVAVSEGSRRGD